MLRWNRYAVAFALIGAVLLCSIGCAVEAKTELVKKGDTIMVVWGFTSDGASLREVLTVDAVLKDGWIDSRNPGDSHQWKVNLSQALEFTPIEVGLSHPPMPLDDGVRERVSR